MVTGANHLPSDVVSESVFTSTPYPAVSQRPTVVDTTVRQVLFRSSSLCLHLTTCYGIG